MGHHRVPIVAGLLIGLSGTPSSARAADPGAPACPPAAVVQGPPEIVGPIVAILRGHGVGTASRACGARIVKASLVADRGAEGYRLRVLDTAGRSSDRQVADAATAASLIESWALDEDADLWAPRPLASAGEGAGVPPAAAVVVEDGAGGARARVQVGVAAETSISPDAAIWWGAGANACARVGVLCVGARASIARAETTLEIDRALGIAPDLTRTLGGLSAFAAWPLATGRFWIAPSLGLGAGWLHSHATQAGVTSTTDDVVARGDAGAVTGVTIGSGWSVALGLGASLPLALRGDARQGTMTYVPAVPRGFLTAGVGLWYAP